MLFHYIYCRSTNLYIKYIYILFAWNKNLLRWLLSLILRHGIIYFYSHSLHHSWIEGAQYSPTDLFCVFYISEVTHFWLSLLELENFYISFHSAEGLWQGTQYWRLCSMDLYSKCSLIYFLLLFQKFPTSDLPF